MTLHDTTELGKKLAIGTGVGVICSILLFILFKVGMFVKDIVFPPKIEPPTLTYNKLPPLEFPGDAATFANSENFTYSLNTTTGTLPEVPDRLAVFPIIHNSPSLLNLDKVKEKVENIGLITREGVVPEVALGGPYYEWEDPDPAGINKKIRFNIVSFDFSLTSNYLTSLTILGAQYLSDQLSSVQTVNDFLSAMTQVPEDIDFEKSKVKQQDIHYVMFPQLFSIQNGALVEAPSLSKAKVIRVQLYQKNIEYELNTGKSGVGGQVKLPVKLPILYPNPPYSTMTFWVASGKHEAEVVEADYTHQEIDQTNKDATYPIITARQAFEELENGNAYIASYYGQTPNILINDVYMAYYLGKESQDYLMPIFVFEGNDGFFAYIPAVSSEWIQ